MTEAAFTTPAPGGLRTGRPARPASVSVAVGVIVVIIAVMALTTIEHVRMFAETLHNIGPGFATSENGLPLTLSLVAPVVFAGLWIWMAVALLQQRHSAVGAVTALGAMTMARGYLYGVQTEITSALLNHALLAAAAAVVWLVHRHDSRAYLGRRAGPPSSAAVPHGHAYGQATRG